MPVLKSLLGIPLAHREGATFHAMGGDYRIPSMGAKFWHMIAESRFPWEREALDFVRQWFPNREPYRAWSNFEFIADDGSINEVDLLLLTPAGLFLIEIKSQPGILRGDPGTWTWQTPEGKLVTSDNPLLAANNKAKKLRSLLEAQKTAKKKGRLPFVEALVFCSAPDLQCDLRGTAQYRVCLRDREATAERPARPGIRAALERRECPGLDPRPKGGGDRETAKIVSQAMEQAGIRPSQRHRKVSDYVLDHLLDEGPRHQDWLAVHVQMKEAKRRVRLYLVRTGATPEERKSTERAALREAQLLETLQHPGILRVYGLTEHEVGPALIFEHEPLSMRLDHYLYLAQHGSRLNLDDRLDLLRQIAEIVRFAHEKKVVHRALSPQSILVTNPATARPRVKIFNWQVGYRTRTSTGGASREVTATSHVDWLVEDASTAYMAPEALADGDSAGEHLDVFSLGAIAYHLFSGVPPAANGVELSNKLRETKGLQISSVLNGASEQLQYLVHFSTHADVTVRTDSVARFLEDLDAVEDELTAPEQEYVDDPTRAQKGDVLPGNYLVKRRLGQGACSVAFLVEHDGGEYVLKAANDPEHNDRLRGEGEVLDKLHHQYIVQYCGTREVGDRVCVLMRRAGEETLGQRRRTEGWLHVDLLQRFGEDLLDVVNYLEEQGIPHRDIKPDNIGVGPVGRGDKLHIILFDFSLSRTPPENIRAGTTGYLDPMLPLRQPKPPRWDLHAERYAAAVTLYELATGILPRWGDGESDPSHLTCEVTVESERFDANLRDGLTDFFTRAFRRNPAERFDNAEEMLRAWRQCFEEIGDVGTLTDREDEAELRKLLACATLDSQVHELALGTRATNALDRANVLTVEDLLTIPLRQLLRLRGVGNKTRREISRAVRILREHLGRPEAEPPPGPTTTEPEQGEDLAAVSVDLLVQRITKTSAKAGVSQRRVVIAILGLDDALDHRWPTQADVAQCVDLTRGRVSQIVGTALARWRRDPAVTRLREQLGEILASAGGVVSAEELSEAVLIARGSIEDEPLRTHRAAAVTRAAVEVERTMPEPRYHVRREGSRVLIATSQELADYAFRLGRQADQLAGLDPLAPPARAVEKLRAVEPTSLGASLADSRLVRLAAAASQQAAISSRQELYPRGMDALRSLRLSPGALLGVAQLTVDDARRRVAGRYPEAEPLPDRPALDDLLRAAGFDFDWDPVGKEGLGCYISRMRDLVSVSSGAGPPPRYPTTTGPLVFEEVTPEIATARQFEERLQRALRDGAFLVLLVHPRSYRRAEQELTRRFPVRHVNFETVFLNALRRVADQAKVNWDVVLKTDARPHQGDWEKLMLLVRRAMPEVENVLTETGETVLLVYANLLGRYDQMDLLERLRDSLGRESGIPGLWVLVPGGDLPMMDGKAVPILGPGQQAQVPESWLQNVHRSNGNGES